MKPLPENENARPDERIVAGMDSTAVLRAVLRRHFGRIRAREAGARLGDDPEELHKMRVGIRRCDSALRLFRRLATSRPSGLRRELRWVNRRLSRVRDLDVQRIFLDTVRGDFEAADAEALDRLDAVLDARRNRARRRMLAAFDSQRWRILGEEMDRWLGDAESAPDGGGPLIGSAAPAIVARALGRAREAARIATPDGPVERIHRFRIRTKRLRYCVEFLGDLWSESADEVLVTLRRAQDVLGELNDCEVSVARWGAIAKDAPDRLGSGGLELIDRLCALRKARSDALRSLVPELVADLHDPLWRRFDTPPPSDGA